MQPQARGIRAMIAQESLQRFVGNKQLEKMQVALLSGDTNIQQPHWIYLRSHAHIAMHLAIEHAWEAGHRDFCLLLPESLSHANQAHWVGSFHTAIASYELAGSPTRSTYTLHHEHDKSQPEHYQRVIRWVRGHLASCLLHVGSDLFARGLREQGLDIPGEVSFISLDCSPRNNQAAGICQRKNTLYKMAVLQLHNILIHGRHLISEIGALHLEIQPEWIPGDSLGKLVNGRKSE